MSGLSGDLSRLKRLSSALRDIPRVVAQQVAAKVAPTITDAAVASFNAGTNPYGDPWAPGADGQRLTLRRTGALAAGIRFVATGTKVRAVLGVKYARFYIGRILPRGGAALPVAWTAAIKDTANAVIGDAIKGAA